jgi:AhpD family alkylhydroperoxidase
MSARFAPLPPGTSSAAARPMLIASEQQFGFLPSPVAKLAASPVLLQHLLAGFGMFDRTQLAPVEREVIAMTVAFETGCHYCMAMHTALLQQEPALVAALRAGTALADPKLEALRLFARAIVREHGRVPAELWAGSTPPATPRRKRSMSCSASVCTCCPRSATS